MGGGCGGEEAVTEEALWVQGGELRVSCVRVRVGWWLGMCACVGECTEYTSKNSNARGQPYQRYATRDSRSFFLVCRCDGCSRLVYV